MRASATDRPPYRRLLQGSLEPVVLTCEHATNRLPVPLPADRPLRDLLRTHWGWDIGAWELTRELASRLRTSAVGGRWSRLWIDLNRRADDPTLIRRVAGGLTLPWNRRVGVAEIERRVGACHAPYHVEIDRLALRRLIRGVRPLIFAVHSFTDNFDGEIRDFDAGVLFEHHRGLAHRLGRSLRDQGLSVRYNQPYSGMAGMMYAADRHGSHHRLPCLELEVNQVLFERPGMARKLGRVVTRAIRELIPHLR